MPLTEAQIKTAQQWVGTGITEDQLNETYDRLDHSLDKTILEILNLEIAEAISGPQSVSLPGGITISQGNNAQYLSEQRVRFLAQGGASGSASAGTQRLVRRPVR